MDPSCPVPASSFHPWSCSWPSNPTPLYPANACASCRQTDRLSCPRLSSKPCPCKSCSWVESIHLCPSPAHQRALASNVDCSAGTHRNRRSCRPWSGPRVRSAPAAPGTEYSSRHPPWSPRLLAKSTLERRVPTRRVSEMVIIKSLHFIDYTISLLLIILKKYLRLVCTGIRRLPEFVHRMGHFAAVPYWFVASWLFTAIQNHVMSCICRCIWLKCNYVVIGRRVHLRWSAQVKLWLQTNKKIIIWYSDKKIILKTKTYFSKVCSEAIA